MRTLGRACQIIALLLGFYVMCAVLIAGLIVLDVLAIDAADRFPALGRLVVVLVLATIGVIIIVVRGVFVSTRVRRKHLPGIVVPPSAEPALWKRITDLAAAAGTRPPKEIRLVPDVNAGVWENTHLLGLLPGKRRMIIGVPLLLSLPLSQFDAVIGHELGHYSGRDVRLGPLTERTRQGVLSALRAVHGSGKKAAEKKARKRFRLPLPGQQLFAVIFQAYANLVFTQTFAASRRQELAADRFAATIAGRQNAAAALRELPVIDASYSFYLDRYISAGLSVGLLPPPAEVLGGFGEFIRDASRAREMSGLRESPSDEAEHKYDSHPTTAERVAAILALPEDGRPVDESGVLAIGLLADPAGMLAAVGAKMLAEHVAGKTVADWETIARAVGTATAQRRATPLITIVGSMIGKPPRLADFLDLVDSGQLNAVLEKIPPTEAAKRTKASGRAAREFARTALGPMVGGWVVAQLIESGLVSIRHNWAQVGGDLTLATGSAGAPAADADTVTATDPDTALETAMDTAIDTAIAMRRPDTAPLRAVLAGVGAAA